MTTGKSLNFADDEDFLPATAATSFFAVSWDGTTMGRPGGRLAGPERHISVELSVLKALGDPGIPLTSSGGRRRTSRSRGRHR